MSRIRGPYVRFCERDEAEIINRPHPTRCPIILEVQTSRIPLSQKELTCLREHRTLQLWVGVAFPPFMWVEKKGDDLIFQGIVSDYVDLLSEKPIVDMQIVFDISFNEALSRGRDGQVDLFPCLSKSPE